MTYTTESKQLYAMSTDQYNTYSEQMHKLKAAQDKTDKLVFLVSMAVALATIIIPMVIL